MNYNKKLYEYAIEILKDSLTRLSTEFETEYARNPIDGVETRIKSMTSINDKLKRRNIPQTKDNILNCIKDIAGVRIICPYLKDIYAIVERLSKFKEIRMGEIEDYIKNPKPNGYRSLHMIIGIYIVFNGQMQCIPVELQLRTLYMNLWANFEHKFCYKSKRKRPWLKAKLKRYADYFAKIDLKKELTGNCKLETHKTKHFNRLVHFFGLAG